MFPTRGGIHTIYIRAQFFNCMRIIALRFQSHSRHISTAGVPKRRTPLFCPVICDYSVGYSVHIDIAMEGILICRLHLCKVFKFLIYTVWNITHSKCWYHHPVMFVNRQLFSLSGRTQHSQITHSFIFHKSFWSFVSVQILQNRNNVKGKVY